MLHPAQGSPWSFGHNFLKGRITLLSSAILSLTYCIQLPCGHSPGPAVDDTVPAEWMAAVLQYVFPLVGGRTEIIISLALWSLISSYFN